MSETSAIMSETRDNNLVTIAVGFPRVPDSAEIPETFKKISIEELWCLQRSLVRKSIGVPKHMRFFTLRVEYDVYVTLLNGSKNENSKKMLTSNDVQRMLGFQVYDEVLHIEPATDFMRGTGLAVEVYDEASKTWRAAGEPPAKGLGYRSSGTLRTVGYARPFTGNFLYMPLPIDVERNEANHLLLCQTLLRARPVLVRNVDLVRSVLKKTFPRKSTLWHMFPPPVLKSEGVMSLSSICMRRVLETCEARLFEASIKRARGTPADGLRRSKRLRT